MRQSYYNTTHETGPALDRNEDKASSQEEIILAWFLQYEQLASPSRCLKLFGPNTPLTSIRRSITNLTTRGLLVKTDMKVMGKYGKREHVWALPMGQRRLF